MEHGGGTLAAFVLPGSIAREVLAHLRDSLPNEGVGLIAVAPARPDVAARFYPGTNVDASPTRYTMEPVEVVAALRSMRAAGSRLGAIAHSHPASTAEPSVTDLREAYYSGVVSLIVSFAAEPPAWRVWRLVGSPERRMAVEIPVMIDYA